MSRSAFIADHIALATSGPWHGPSLDKLLGDVTAMEAQARPIPGAHSIAELAAHMAVWVRAAAKRLDGIPAAPTEKEQWTPMDTSSDTAWKSALGELRSAHDDLIARVRTMSDAELDARVVKRRHAAATMLHGIIEHDAYHGGQIALLKKMIRGRQAQASG